MEAAKHKHTARQDQRSGVHARRGDREQRHTRHRRRPVDRCAHDPDRLRRGRRTTAAARQRRSSTASRSCSSTRPRRSITPSRSPRQARLQDPRPLRHLPADRGHLHAVLPGHAARGRAAGWLFGVIWALAIVGIATEAFWPYRPRWLSAAVYLGMGWLVVFIDQAARRQPRPGGPLAARGGRPRLHARHDLLRAQEVRYLHAVWHLFVLAGSICHFLAVLALRHHPRPPAPAQLVLPGSVASFCTRASPSSPYFMSLETSISLTHFAHL